MSMSCQYELGFAVFVNNTCASLQPYPFEIFRHKPVCNQTSAACLDNCVKQIPTNDTVHVT
jgi:hypothetical protein